MKQESRAAGFALILGALMGIATMMLHPTGHDLLTPGSRGERMGELAVLVHAVALAGVPISVFGFLGLTRRLEAGGWIPIAAFVVYAFGSVAVLCAAVASGLIAPRLIRDLSAEEPSMRESLHLLLRYTGLFNQAFARVFVVASSVAVILWSAALTRSAVFARGLAVLGHVVGVVSLAAFFSGHLRLDVHGFGLFVLAQAAWTITVGSQMVRRAESAEVSAPEKKSNA